MSKFKILITDMSPYTSIVKGTINGMEFKACVADYESVYGVSKSKILYLKIVYDDYLWPIEYNLKWKASLNLIGKKNNLIDKKNWDGHEKKWDRHNAQVIRDKLISYLNHKIPNRANRPKICDFRGIEYDGEVSDISTAIIPYNANVLLYDEYANSDTTYKNYLIENATKMLFFGAIRGEHRVFLDDVIYYAPASYTAIFTGELFIYEGATDKPEYGPINSLNITLMDDYCEGVDLDPIKGSDRLVCKFENGICTLAPNKIYLMHAFDSLMGEITKIGEKNGN